MAKVDNRIIEIIRKFIDEASKDRINIAQALLFGSYAKGTAHEWSDIDVAVVSSDFEGNSFYDSRKLTDAMLRTNINIELHPYRPEDFTGDNPFVAEILIYGIRII